MGRKNTRQENTLHWVCTKCGYASPITEKQCVNPSCKADLNTYGQIVGKHRIVSDSDNSKKGMLSIVLLCLLVGTVGGYLGTKIGHGSVNLDGDEAFWGTAFTAEQKNAIVKRPECVSLLTYPQLVIDEYSRYGFNCDGKQIGQAHLCKYSDYAVAKGLSTYKNGYGDWWLGTPTAQKNKALIVDGSGKMVIREISVGTNL